MEISFLLPGNFTMHTYRLSGQFNQLSILKNGGYFVEIGTSSGHRHGMSLPRKTKIRNLLHKIIANKEMFLPPPFEQNGQCRSYNK